MNITLVVAASDNNVIGKDNQLLWHLPKDMRFFKNTTWGLPILMGRKTFESLGNKVLPGRLNLILSAMALPQIIPVVTAARLSDQFRGPLFPWS